MNSLLARLAAIKKENMGSEKASIDFDIRLNLLYRRSLCLHFYVTCNNIIELKKEGYLAATENELGAAGAENCEFLIEWCLITY